MKILAIADEECASLWDFFDKSKVADIDLIISCGDLDPRYLSFLVTMTTAPVLYVHGNHDGIYERKEPEGCICIENQIYEYKGIKILGLGGSCWYNGGSHQYTQNKEEYYYRSIFEEHFPSQSAARSVPSVPSVACSTAEALPWDATLQGKNDPSGRAVADVLPAVPCP